MTDENMRCHFQASSFYSILDVICSCNFIFGFFFRERKSIIYVEFKTGEFNALLFGLLFIFDGQQKQQTSHVSLIELFEWWPTVSFLEIFDIQQPQASLDTLEVLEV